METTEALWAVTAAAFLAWIVLICGRGRYWRASPRLEAPRTPPSGQADRIVAVIPARNEADVLPRALPSVLVQDYPGPFAVRLVGDQSTDGTATAACSVAAGVGAKSRLQVVRGRALPAGWSGKVWAMAQGVAEEIADGADAPVFYWFTDADIAHAPWVLRALVEVAEEEKLDLVSVMATLRVASVWDRLLIPAFVYFFAKLYPFRWVGDPRKQAAGAAGGCVLVRRSALDRAGGLETIRSAVIDDCALGRLIKRAGGRLWLGYSAGVRSLRDYGSLASVWDMVARSAYTQLRHSPVLLAGTVVGMLFLYALPLVVCLGGAVAALLRIPGAVPLVGLGGATWAAMSASFLPLLRHHGVGAPVAPLLPVSGVLYTAMTVSSAWRHLRGRGGAWKGRTYGS